MHPEIKILRLTAFAASPEGGNPAGVVLDAADLSAEQMQSIAQQVGYAESAFVTSAPQSPTPSAPGRVGIRYFSPDAEVPFCGHATVATAVALAERYGVGNYLFDTGAGQVALATADSAGGVTASFTSVEPWTRDIDRTVLVQLLGLLNLQESELHPSYPVKISFAGNPHPILVLAETSVFDDFSFDPAKIRALMDEQGWTGTITVLRVLNEREFEARNLFPVGAITEDPATGSAAASVGAYLRAIGAVQPPAHVQIHQGKHVGRPSILHVDIPETGGITVTGSATVI